MPIAQLKSEGIRPSEKARQKATAAYLLSQYASTRKASRFGSGTRPRGLSDPDDIPSIVSSSIVNPASDPTDPATRRINFVNGYAYETAGTTPITQADFLAPREYYRGINETMTQNGVGSDLTTRVKVIKPGSTGGNAGSSTSIESGAEWAISAENSQISFVFYGSVFYLRVHSWSTFGAILFVNGEPVIPTAVGGDITNPAGLPWALLSPNGGRWVKVKFPTEARRVISILQLQYVLPTALMVPATSVIHGNPAKVRVGVFGDSFTSPTVSDSAVYTVGDAWVNVFHAQYALSTEMFNFGVAGSGFSGTAFNFTMPGIPTSEYVNGNYASQRKVLQLCTKGLDLDLILYLGCHNDMVSLPIFKDEVKAFWTDARNMHPNAILVQAGTNASPWLLSDDTDLVNEQKLAEACAEVGVRHIPMQTGVSRLFNGTGSQYSPNGSGNTDVLIGTDNIHPTIAGHSVIGKFLADRVAGYLGEFE